MGQIRETLGTEAVLSTVPVLYDDAVAAIRKQRPDLVIVGFDSDPEEAVRLAPLLLTEAGQKLRLVAHSSGADPDRSAPPCGRDTASSSCCRPMPSCFARPCTKPTGRAMMTTMPAR